MKLMTKNVLANAVAGLFLMGGSGLVYAGCGIEKGSVRVLGNEFPAIQAVVAAAETCGGDGVEFSKNLTKENRDIQVAALTANPSEYTTAIIANSTLVTLMNDGLVRPLDDLVASHGSALKKNQLITINGKVMAVAFMANAQHLMYRKDVLAAAGVEVPASYEDMIAAAKAIKEQGLMEYPIAGTFKEGWNLGEEFVNMFMGHGGEFFKAGSAELNINNEAGINTLNAMKALTDYMNPDYLTHDSNAVQADWEAGNVALTNLCGSRAGAILDDEGSTAEVTENTGFAAAPTVSGGTDLATTRWWDGFAIASNISDEDAEASFIAMMNGITTDVATENGDAAVWLIDGYEPGASAVGVAASAQGGAEPYPMLPYMGLLHGAAGAELVDFLKGSESAEQALADIEAAYVIKAKEGGFL